MRPNALKRAMIRTAVDKGIKEIKQNPDRGLRKLVELGEMFSKDKQKNFFEIASAELANPDSCYQKLVGRIVVNTDSQILSTFGINFGFNGMVHSSSVIKENEKRLACNIPWILSLNLGKDIFLNPSDIEHVITQGREMGIYNYIFNIDKNYPYLERLFEIANKENDCAYAFFVSPDMVNGYFIRATLMAKVVMPVINLDSDEKLVANARNALVKYHCLFGGFSSIENIKNCMESGKDILSIPTKYKIPLFFIIRPENAEGINDDFYELVKEKRKNLDRTVFPIDINNDISYTGRKISDNPFVVSIKNDGTIKMQDISNNIVKEKYNIHQMSLREVFMRGMHKK